MQASPGQEHDWDHRRGLAFTEILEHLPTDHLHPKTAATVVVTIDHTVLGPWATGGRTDLADALPLCHRHHQWIHDTAYTHQRLPDGSLRFTRRT
jgi:hypothetical protein